MKTIKISRKRWGRGNGCGALRTESGQSCCLGFVARAYGLRTPTDTGQFSDLADDQNCSVLPKQLRPTKSNDDGCYTDTALHHMLVEANDGTAVRGSEREEKIRKLMLKAGIKAVFVD